MKKVSPFPKSSYLAATVLTVGLAISAGTASAQCTIVYSGDTEPAANTVVFLRVFQGSQLAIPCSVTASMNVGFCTDERAPSGLYGCTNTMGCRALVATAMGVTTNPTPRSCQFDCGPCGTQLIDNSDGLPVELMGFSVEEGEVAGEPESSGEEDSR